LKRITKYFPFLFIVITLIIWHTAASYAQPQRFPNPEFEGGYSFPTRQFISPQAIIWNYIDVAALIIALLAAAFMVLKQRSRHGLLWVSALSLIYFGFFRQGCICAVGSIQNISLSLFNSAYSIPVTALLFFIIPLVAALLFGRVFCAGVCPLGAIQEVTGFKRIKMPRKLEAILAALPYVYLGLAVLFAATESQFLICRYDPFVGIFRVDAPVAMVIFGTLLLIVGVFINRPYCRYLCPYGVLQNLFSRFSFRHMTITPAECRNCRLCESACPYDAVLQADPNPEIEPEEISLKKSSLYFAMIPALAIAFAVILYNIAPSLAIVNNNVKLAKEIRLENENGINAFLSKSAIAFYESGSSETELFNLEQSIINRFKKGAPWVGAFFGISLGIGFVRRIMRTKRHYYEPDKGRCVSCAKCMKVCPVKIKN
jgi:polyferredoxin